MAVFLLLVTAMLLFPLPTMLLDLLLVSNLALSVLLLLAGLYLSNALALLSFPSILLLTTLFRLSLNVASTRLILSQGSAGQVIQAFGSFLIRGEIVVGIIIFLILTVVNFIVIARGSSRVSEVAARFALDALPGKQMAIDSDLRSGLISAEQAQERREDLRRESQLYGSMDGAMKFVQGDAIAGLFIIVTNIFGGMYLGVRSGMTLSEAGNTYTILTVGDGLVTQIPAILISICAGIVVTRVSSGDDASLGSDVQRQVFGRPGTILFVGLLMCLLGLLPYLPDGPFLTIGLLLCASAFWMWRSPEPTTSLPSIRSAALPVLPRLGGGADGGASVRFLPEKPNELTMIMHLDQGTLYPFYTAQSTRYHTWWEEVTRDFFHDLGMHLPELRVIPDERLGVGRFQVLLGGAPIEDGAVRSDAVLGEVGPLNATLLGLRVLEEDRHPLSGSRVTWVPLEDEYLQVLQVGSIRYFDPIEYVGLRAVAFFRRHPEELLGIAEILAMEQKLEEAFPGLITQTLDRNFFTTARITEIVQQLVREGIGVRDFRHIVEALASYGATQGAVRLAEGDFIVEEIVGFVRRARRRHLISRYYSQRQTLKVVTLSQEVENLFEEAKADEEARPVLAPEVSERLTSGLERIIEPLASSGILPVTVLCRDDLRSRVAAFLMGSVFHPVAMGMGTIAFEELDPSVAVEPVAVWRE